jgi:propanol-preferring alcohol dehydrogenase
LKDTTAALAFAAEGKVKAHFRRTTLDDVNDVFDALKAGTVDGRIVLDMTLQSEATLVHRAAPIASEEPPFGM